MAKLQSGSKKTSRLYACTGVSCMVCHGRKLLCVLFVWPQQIRSLRDDYVKSFDWLLLLSSTFCTSVVPHSSSGISDALETSGEGSSFLVLCTPVARARSIHCCKNHGVSTARCSANTTMSKSQTSIKSFYCKVLISFQRYSIEFYQ